jgi:hypothetical protein
MPLNSKERQDFIKSFIAYLFPDKINPKKFLAHLSAVLNDGNLVTDIEKHWIERNKEIEKKVYQEFGTNAAREIKQIVEQKTKEINRVYRFAKTMEGVSEQDIKNWLPVDKLLYNQDIFYNRLRGVDLNNIDSSVEKRIIQALEKDAKGMSRQEILFYYSLIKANRIASSQNQVKARRQIEEKKYFKTIGSALLGLVYPKRINGKILEEINDGVKIDRETLRDNLIDKIQNQRFSPYPYLILFGIDKKDRMFQHFVGFANLTKYLGEDPEKIMNYTIFYILFKGSSENFIKLSNLQKPALDFLSAKTSAPFSPEGAGMIRFMDTFFYALCTQIYEINRNYQKANDVKKAKIYKLYSSEDRLRMLVQNSLSVALKVIQRMKLDHNRLLGTVKRYIDKQKGFLQKEDIFSSVLDFENLTF